MDVVREIYVIEFYVVDHGDANRPTGKPSASKRRPGVPRAGLNPARNLIVAICSVTSCGHSPYLNSLATDFPAQVANCMSSFLACLYDELRTPTPKSEQSIELLPNLLIPKLSDSFACR